MAIAGQGQVKLALLGVPAQGAGLGRIADREHRAKAHGFAKNLGILHLIVGEQAEQGFQPRSGAGVFVAVQEGEAQKDPTGVVKAAKIGAGGAVKAGFGAVIGMGAPGGVVQQAGGLDQAQAVFADVGVKRFEKFKQHLAGAGDAGGDQFGHPGGFDQRIALAQAVGHHLVQHALADAIGRDVDFGGFEQQDQFAQDFAGEGHQFHPFGRGAGAGAQQGEVGGEDPLEGVKQRAGQHAVFMQHGQRVIAAFHVKPGDDAPRAADEVDAFTFGANLSLQALENLDDVVLAVAGGALDLLQAEGAERGAGAAANLTVTDAGQFHRIAAHVADDTLGIGPAEQDALGRQPGLFIAIDDPKLEAGLGENFGLKSRAVAGLTGGGGGDDGQLVDAHATREQGKAFEGVQRTGAAFGVEFAGFSQALAKAAHDLFVVEIGGRAGGTVKDHHTDRVGADIDDADPAEGAGGGVEKQRATERAPVFTKFQFGLGFDAEHGRFPPLPAECMADAGLWVNADGGGPAEPLP